MSKVKAIFRCQESFKREFSNSSCLLTISVGQATHEDELFAATMELVGKSFSSCTILVDDLLQRHTIAITSKHEPDYFWDLSLKEGGLWLARSKKYLDNLGIPLRILRWERWLNHPNFQQQLGKIKDALAFDKEYKETIDSSIDDFLAKLSKRLPDCDNFDWDRARRLSLDFVLEECASLSLWPELNCNFEIYPIKHNIAINKTREKFILPYYERSLLPVNVIFRNAKQMKPQNFVLLNNE